VEIQRGDDIIAPVPPEQVLHDNDTLTFTGVVTTIVDLEKIPGLVPVADGAYEEEAVRRRGRRLCEAVVSPSAGVVGKTVRAADFRATFGAAVIAVHRGGERLQGKVGDVVLRAGDALLLQTSSHFARAFRNNPSFLLVSGVEDSRPPRSDKAILSLALLGLLIVLMTTGILDIVTSAFVVGGLLIATRCISASDARQSVDYQTLITIAAAFGLSKALVNSGAVALVAEGLVLVTENLGPYALLLGIYILTSIFTETVTNNAAAALVFPFAVAVAGKVDIDPRPLVMAVTFAASASFITPIGYQTNLMVYGPGGYRFVDFVKIGLPLNLILLLCASVLIPLVWPF
jgi:di/tricarboxylate transporter